MKKTSTKPPESGSWTPPYPRHGTTAPMEARFAFVQEKPAKATEEEVDAELGDILPPLTVSRRFTRRW